METMRQLLRYGDPEASIWVTVLAVLALCNSHSDFHFTIFWLACAVTIAAAVLVAVDLR